MVQWRRRAFFFALFRICGRRKLASAASGAFAYVLFIQSFTFSQTLGRTFVLALAVKEVNFVSSAPDSHESRVMPSGHVVAALRQLVGVPQVGTLHHLRTNVSELVPSGLKIEIIQSPSDCIVWPRLLSKMDSEAYFYPVDARGYFARVLVFRRF